MIRKDEIAEAGSAARQLLDRLDLAALPRHVAIIMDGNGRWAQGRGLPRVEGHRAGIKAVRESIETAARLELEVITLYAFSTENWKRPRHEVMTLMGLLKEYIDLELDTFRRYDLQFRPIGNLAGLDPGVQKHLARAVKATARGRGTTVQIALNYSGRQELVDVARQACAAGSTGGLQAADIDESWVSAHLTTAGWPDPDLLIRSSGEQRISNFLLWQLAYAEIYFTEVLWPDFTRLDFLHAIAEYQRRERRFGGIIEPPTAGP